MASSRIRESGGFALALTIMALVLVAAIVATGYFTASQETRIGLGMKAVTTSFYAGESGIQAVLEDWDAAAANSLSPGDSLMVGPATLEGGETYLARIARVDDGTQPLKRYFYVEALGRGSDRVGGGRRQAVVARVRFHQICCGAAIVIADSMTLESNTAISGFNSDPLGWLSAGACVGLSTDDAPGVRTSDAGLVTSAGGTIQGSPQPVVADGSVTAAALIQYLDLTYADIVADADHDLAPGASISTVGPVLNGAKCDHSATSNWGAPDDPSDPCFDYFPIIHAQGDLSLTGKDAGQGILLVDGDLQISGQFTYYGIIIVRGALDLGGRATVRGGILIPGDAATGGSRLHAPNARVQLSRCAIERAERLSALARGRLLEERSWVDLF